ncbi:Thoeris anti-defense Tad2 family protein [Bacteroides sp. UBA939]|uniref:Thoeris anti-defense Tad2 family protein n=1 Tax=Bacteroides sp. UBA939 TaxID=1946092 RepID=UPI0025C62702|nr:MW1434 family type I TA system toxin [Bacteroides sp. UBA939]
MKTLDEKAVLFSDRIANQSGVYSKGELETAYVTGATENQELTSDECGTFGQAIVSLQRGFNIARKEWGGKCFIVKQINSDIASDIVPKMQSLPDAAKKEISKHADGSIHYREQCLVVYPDAKCGCMATNYVPDWQDMFSNDWIIIE